MSRPTEFELTDEHIALLRRMCVGWSHIAHLRLQLADTERDVTSLRQIAADDERDARWIVGQHQRLKDEPTKAVALAIVDRCASKPVEHVEAAEQRRNELEAYLDVEYGAPEIDPKRPYGNSDVVQDIFKIFHPGEEWDSDYGLPKRMSPREWAEEAGRYGELHAETQFALQIVLSTGSFEPGLYELTHEYDSTSWKRRDT